MAGVLLRVEVEKVGDVVHAEVGGGHFANYHVFAHQHFRLYAHCGLVDGRDDADVRIDVDVYLVRGLIDARRLKIGHKIAIGGAYGHYLDCHVRAEPRE